MTIREAFENCLIELNKVLAPSLLVDDFVYLFKKAILKYINKKYNQFEVNQQLTDDLRVLTKTLRIDYTTSPKLIKMQSPIPGAENIFDVSYTCELPLDYMHILNCICEFKSDKRCDPLLIHTGANKIDSAEWPHSIDNYYMKPSIRRPYYYISNIVNPSIFRTSTDGRFGNASLPQMLIKCGTGDLQAVFVDYLRAPKDISLTSDDLDSVVDTTATLEFPDYVVYEIINDLVTLILENGKDQRLQTFVPMQLSVASGVSK